MTTRIFLIAAAALVVLAGTAIAAKSGPKATGGVFNTASGTGNMQYVEFNAKPTADPSDGDAGTGRINFRLYSPTGDLIRHYKGEVECYSQDGNTAIFAGEVTKTLAETGTPRTHFKMVVMDDGEGEGATDRIRVRGTDTNVPFDCSEDTTASDVEDGNVQVHEVG